MKESIKKALIWILIFAIFYGPDLFVFLQENAWLPNDYARIVDMDYKAVLVDEPGSEGKVVVTERFTFDVHAAFKFNGFWELWRDLCEDKIDGLKIYYKVNSVSQILPDGTKIPWEESPVLYWEDEDYTDYPLGPEKWFYSPGPYDESMDRYECVFFYVDNLYREKITFEIEYEVYNVALRYNDCSDLYLLMFSEKDVKYLESFNAEILIPDKDMPREGNYTAVTYGTNSDTFAFEESDTKNPGYHTFSFSLDKDDLKFKPYNQYIEFELISYGEDKHIFAENSNYNRYTGDNVLEEVLEEKEYYSNLTEFYKPLKLKIFIVCVCLSIFVVVIGFVKVFLLRKRYPNYEILNPIDTYRDIPSDLDPKFAAALVFCKDKTKENDEGIYSALLLSLARKKYIEIEESYNDDVNIFIRTNNFTTDESKVSESNVEYVEELGTFVSRPIELRENLTLSEAHYFNLLKRHTVNNHISMKDFQSRISSDYKYTDSFAKNIEKAVIDNGITLGYFQKAKYLEPKQKLKSSGISHIVWGLIILIFINLLSRLLPIDLAFGGYTILGSACIAMGIYLIKQSRNCILLTEFGEQEYVKWRGLYNFLKSDTLIKERTLVELPLWEKYLVYATAFGISEKVIEAIKIRCPEINESSNNSIVTSSYCRSGRYRSHGRSFHRSVSHGSSMHYAISYGGGGRGGGGGGGGH